MVGVPCQSSDWELPSLFLRPHCQRPDTPSREAVVVMAVVVMAVVVTAAATAVADISAVVIAAVAFMAVVAATRILAVGISPSAIFTADRRISVPSLAMA